MVIGLTLPKWDCINPPSEKQGIATTRRPGGSPGHSLRAAGGGIGCLAASHLDTACQGDVQSTSGNSRDAACLEQFVADSAVEGSGFEPFPPREGTHYPPR